MTFDPTKPVQTRNKRPARILCTDRKGRSKCTPELCRSVTYLMTELNGFEVPRVCYPDGRASKRVASPYDLVNIPEENTVWMNFYFNWTGRALAYAHESELSARRAAKSTGGNHMATAIKVTFPVGYGIDDE